MDIMTILEALLQHSVWAAVSVYLFHHMTTESKAREDRYNALIDRLGDRIEQGIEDVNHKLDLMAGNSTDK